jgi:glycosyltransferase involved in cell wall biosynthesis
MWYRSEPDLFRSKGHEVVIYEKDNKAIESYSKLQKAALFWKVAWSQETYDEFSTLLKREKPDIVHVYNTLALVSPSIFYSCRDAGVPVVQTNYNYRLVCPAATLLRNGKVCEECLDHSLFRAIQHKCYRDSVIQSASLAGLYAFHRLKGTWTDVVNGYIVPTDFIRNKLAEGGVPRDKIHVKPNWHDPDPGMRTESGIDCLYVGRLSEEKGIRTVVEAWRTTVGLPKVRIIGDGPLKDEIVAKLTGTMASPAEYLGRKTHEEVIAEMKRSLCFLLPSEWYEAFPHTILEAYACGVPIVASNLGTMRDVIEDGQTGALYESGNPAALAAAVQKIAADPALSSQMALQARSAFVEKYSVEPAYAHLKAIYEKVIG